MQPPLQSLVALVFLVSAAPMARAADDPWHDYRFLIGRWEAIGQPGQGTGRFSLLPGLDGKVLVRKNHAELPAAGNRPAGIHDDLLVMYPEGKRMRAIYFDNEGHVIHYTVTADKQAVVFVSDEAAGTPRFRLTYTPAKDATVKITFEMAPPGKPDAFRVYLEGSARKEAASR